MCAIEIDESSLEALDQLALVHLERGELDLADGVVDRALAIDPDHAIAHETRALVAMRRGDVHAAPPRSIAPSRARRASRP